MQPVDPLVTILREWQETLMRHSMSDMIHYSKEIGLTMPQLGALFRIQNDACGVSEVGEHLGVTNAAASQMLERLVQQGLILRSEDPYDRRAKQIVLTEKGRQLVQRSIHLRESWIQKLVASLSLEEKEKIVVAFNLLLEKNKHLEASSITEETHS